MSPRANPENLKYSPSSNASYQDSSKVLNSSVASVQTGLCLLTPLNNTACLAESALNFNQGLSSGVGSFFAVRAMWPWAGNFYKIVLAINMKVINHSTYLTRFMWPKIKYLTLNYKKASGSGRDYHTHTVWDARNASRAHPRQADHPLFRLIGL